MLGLPSDPAADAGDLVELVHAGVRWTLRTTTVGLACCALEAVAGASRAAGDRTVRQTGDGRPRQAGTDDPAAEGGAAPAVEVLVVAGTVTDKLAPGVLALHRANPSARVLSFGACSNTGGPYWDSYSVTKGVDQLLPVDVYVPGCPPRPEALLDGLRTLAAHL